MVYEKAVLGSGQTIEDAEADAERNLSPDAGTVTPVTVFLRTPDRPLYTAWIKQLMRETFR
ncbi:MAG: hypothetical protein JXA10_15975 [Anaerolineae bacterium]|nr:hypothetical protein [Anaerolineae bacterium]